MERVQRPATKLIPSLRESQYEPNNCSCLYYKLTKDLEHADKEALVVRDTGRTSEHEQIEENKMQKGCKEAWLPK